MGSFSFKSVGKTQEERQAQKLAQTSLPIGIVTPLRSGDDGFLAMNLNVADQMHDNLRNLLLTNWGERLGFYDFGANLRPLVTDFVSQDDFDTLAIDRIRNAVGRWMPFVDLEDFSSEVDRIENKNTGIIRLTLTYNIQTLNVKDKPLQVSLYVI